MPTTYAIPNGRTVMDATLWTGNNTSGRNISGLNFQPDFVWLKSRTSADFHRLQNTNAGINKLLFSNATNAEQTNEANGYVSAVTSNGYTLTAGGSGISGVNSTGNTYVGWSWLASPTTSSNTSGSITSTVSVNATAGFSIVSYTGTGSNGTVGHGLGVAPSFYVVKGRNFVTDWHSWHTSLGGGTYFIKLNQNGGSATEATLWNSTIPTSSVFSLGTAGGVNNNGSTYVAYCWAPVAGFSQFGSYTGNGSTDGPFVYTGFRPRFWMVKRTDSASDWFMMDSARNTFNVANLPLIPNSAGAEFTYTTIDFLSNGLKVRNTGADINANGGTYIYMAFAENPFKFSNAR
jgi:hypothetical protein